VTFTTSIDNTFDTALCFSDPTDITFRYTGCPCGALYSITNATYDLETGTSEFQYSCWEPTESNWTLDVDEHFFCQDYDASLIQYDSSKQVSWIATPADNTSLILGSGTVSEGELYSISSGDVNVPLPEWLHITFYVLDANNEMVTVQSNHIPTDFCTGDPYYHTGFPQTQVVAVQDLNAGSINLQDTVQDALWLTVAIDATNSPSPVRIDEFNIIANTFGNPLNLTDTVRGIALSNAVAAVATEGVAPTTHELVVGPMPIDLYWRTRYSFFGTVLASNMNDPSKICNGWDYSETIGGVF
jgi:hypothetical protein